MIQGNTTEFNTAKIEINIQLLADYPASLTLLKILASTI